MEQCALRFQDEIYLPYTSWPTSCLPSEAGTTQTVLEALAAILDAAGRVSDGTEENGDAFSRRQVSELGRTVL